MLSLFPGLFIFEPVAPFILRLVLAAIFLAAGTSKLFKGRQETFRFFDSIGIKPAKFWVIFVGITEIACALMFILGLFTQLAALLVAIIMVMAIVKFKRKQGFLEGYDLDLLILVIAVALLLLGPGVFSLDLPL